MLSKNRDESAAKAFLIKAIGLNKLPEKITIDKSGVNKAGIDTINLQLIILFLLGCILIPIDIGQIKYLNNIVEQDHDAIKRIIKPMMDSNHFIQQKRRLLELNYRMLKKGQYMIRKIHMLLSNFMYAQDSCV